MTENSRENWGGGGALASITQYSEYDNDNIERLRDIL